MEYENSSSSDSENETIQSDKSKRKMNFSLKLGRSLYVMNYVNLSKKL